MTILAVDDEMLMLAALESAIREAAPEGEVHCFRRGGEALSFAAQTRVDVAFLDIRMRGMDGLELAKALMEQNPLLNVIFCTGYDDYVSEAFRKVRCNGYITKPVDAEQVANELKHLRYPAQLPQPTRLRLQCFGYFEAFAGEKPLEFSYSKSKELLAYLVHARGAVCSNQELIAYLWEDDADHDAYFKRLRKDVTDTLKAHGCEDVLIRQRGGLGIRTDRVDCDYYQWRKLHSTPYVGEYMKQYSWAEFR